ncbi:hypothetical protein O3M35_000820 [Rhynocoris fuscipes]|uniref:Uncharacterized protein n=1 Tax=Rhynocoris fuscipes TaxID=488301 RepID=A0AAW1DMX6_9HEMI
MIFAWMFMSVLAAVFAAPAVDLSDCNPATIEAQSSKVRSSCAGYLMYALKAYLDEDRMYQVIPDTIPYSSSVQKRQDIDHVFMRFGRRR